MPVVVNDFEVVAEQPPRADAPAEANAQPPAAGPTPQELEMVYRRMEERAARVRAD